MVQLSIRCQPCVPVAPEQLEGWLSDQVADLRGDVPQGTVRLSRLCQQRGEGDVPVGWLLELDLFEAESERLRRRIDEALTDMRLLGLQPTVLAPLGEPFAGIGSAEHPNEHHTPSPQAPATATIGR